MKPLPAGPPGRFQFASADRVGNLSWRLVVLLLCLAGLSGCQKAPRKIAIERIALVRPDVRITDGSIPLKYPRWSEDGNRIAAVGFDENSLWVLSSDGQGLRKVAEGAGIGPAFCWCGDRVIVYRTARYVKRRRLWQLMAVDLVTGSRRTLVQEAGRMSVPQSAGDGATVAVQIGDSLRLFHLASADGDIEFRELTPRAWSTESERGFLVVRRGSHLYLWLPGRSLPKEISLPVANEVMNVRYQPKFSWFAYERLGCDSVFVGEGARNGRALGPGHRPAWSPRGPFLACEIERTDGLRTLQADIVLYDLAADTSFAVTHTPDRLERAPSWSPDGKRLAYYDERTGVLYFAEFVYEASGGKPESR